MDYKMPNTSELIEEYRRYCVNFILFDEWKEWYDDGCPYDHSGQTRNIRIPKQRYIENLEIVDGFCLLDYLYTGATEATYVSHYGLRHKTLADDMREDFERELLDSFIELNLDPNLTEWQERDECIEFLFEEFYSLDNNGSDDMEKLIAEFTPDAVLKMLGDLTPEEIEEENQRRKLSHAINRARHLQERAKSFMNKEKLTKKQKGEFKQVLNCLYELDPNIIQEIEWGYKDIEIMYEALKLSE